MRLSRLYHPGPLALSEAVLLPDASAHYVRHVLRLKQDQQVVLFDGVKALDYTAHLDIRGRQLWAIPVSCCANNLESPISILLLQALGRTEHNDLVVQKATELGISKIRFFNAEHTQSPLKSSRVEKKLLHWRRIAQSACEQCGRSLLPTIDYNGQLQQALQDSLAGNRILLDYNGEPLSGLYATMDETARFTLLVGAEGGFSRSEKRLAQDSGFIACEMGPRVLRMETAALAMISLLQHRFGDM